MRVPSFVTTGLVAVSAASLVVLGLSGLDDHATQSQPVAPWCGTITSADMIDGVCYQGTEYHGNPTIDTDQYGTDIPRCDADDYNSTGLPRCYVEGPGTIIIVGQDDETIATLG